MKTKSIFLVGIVYLASLTLQAQKALPVEINGLLSRIPMPQNSQADFESCTKVTDPSNHTVSVKDAGPEIMDIETSLKKDMDDLGMTSITTSSGTTTMAMPTSDQMAQAEAMAQQMQGESPEQARKTAQQMAKQQQQQQEKDYQSADPALMQELGKAQTANGQLQPLINELSSKVLQLGSEHQQKLDQVKQPGSCEEYKVQGADIALPKCGCVKDLYLNYYQERVSVENEYLQQLDEILQKYLPQIKVQVAIIDKAEKDLQYGDAVSMPAYKSQVVNLQQSTLGSIAPIFSMVEQAFKDSGTEYTGVYNINNGHLPEDCQ